MLRWLFLAGVACLIAGCATRPNPPAPAQLPKMTPANSSLRESDPELEAAIQKARASLDGFIQRLNHPQRAEVFSIEATFQAPDGTPEHLWIDDVVYKDGVFKGKLRTKPLKVSSVKAGDQVSVKKAEVTDWMILKSGASEGGYTVDVLIRREGQPH